MKFFRRIAFMAVALALALQTSPAYATDLGEALNFAVLSLNSGVIFGTDSAWSGAAGGQSTLVRANSSTGDLVASPRGIVLKAGSNAGNCITSGKAILIDPSASCASQDTSGTNPELMMLSQALIDVATYIGAINAQTPTQMLPRIRVSANDSQQISVSGGLNVITIPSVTLKINSALTIAGGAGDSAILVIHGNLSVGKDALLSTSNFNSQLPENHLVILVQGASVLVGKNSVLNGTIIAPKATCTLQSGFASRGAYLCGKTIMLQNQDAQGDSGAIDFEPTQVTL